MFVDGVSTSENVVFILLIVGQIIRGNRKDQLKTF